MIGRLTLSDFRNLLDGLYGDLGKGNFQDLGGIVWGTLTDTPSDDWIGPIEEVATIVEENDATVLALRSLLDNATAEGTIDVASTSVSDPLSFALAQTMAMSAKGELVIHIFAPFSTQPPSARTAVVFIEPGSDP